MTPSEFRRQADHRFGAVADVTARTSLRSALSRLSGSAAAEDRRVSRHRSRHVRAQGCCCSTSSTASSPAWASRSRSSRPHPLWSEQAPADWWSALDSAMQRLRDSTAGRAGRGARHRARRARCTARCCSTPTTRCCARRSCGTTAAAAPQCAALEAARADAARDRRQPRDAGLHRAQAAAGCASTSRTVFARTALRAAAQGLAAPAAHRRARQRDVRRLGHAVARRRRARAGPTSCSPPAASRSQPHAAPGRRQRGLGPAASPRWRRAGACRPASPVAGGGGDNAASAVGIGAVRPGQGFVSLGHLGRDLRGQRPLPPEPRARPCTRSATRCPERWHQMSVMLSAASALRWARELLGLAERGGAARHAWPR